MNSMSNASAADKADGLFGGRQLVKALQGKAKSILDSVIPDGKRVALLDFPNNSNVGDSLIWLGEIEYLKQRGIEPVYVCDIRNLDTAALREALGDNGLILLSGGGNFGTLWPEVQAFRLRILREFIGTPIVQMPQSLSFDDEAVTRETALAIKEHGDFVLAVRDHTSHRFAATHFECKLFLCPDMAFFIGSIAGATNAPFDRFILARTDHESAQKWFVDAPELRAGLKVRNSDWLEQGLAEKILNRLQFHSVGLRRVFDRRNKGLYLIYNALARARMARGKALLESGRVVIADRLHVHILSVLLEKPHVLIDNSYRKVGTFHEAWTNPYRGVTFVGNLREAYAAAATFDQAAGGPGNLALQS